jgi:hypothetical protein
MVVEFFTPYSYNEWRPAKTVTFDHKINLQQSDEIFGAGCNGAI